MQNMSGLIGVEVAIALAAFVNYTIARRRERRDALHIFHKLNHTVRSSSKVHTVAAHMADHVDHLAGSVGASHLLFVLVAAVITVVHRNH